MGRFSSGLEFWSLMVAEAHPHLELQSSPALAMNWCIHYIAAVAAADGDRSAGVSS